MDKRNDVPRRPPLEEGGRALYENTRKKKKDTQRNNK